MKFSSAPRRVLALAIGMIAAQGMAQAATPAGTAITNQASAVYLDSTLALRSATSNIVTTTVQQVAAVGVSAGSAKTAGANAQVVYAHTITNNGNATDSFTFAAANSGGFAMTGVQFFADADGNGIADNGTPVTATGALQPGASYKVVAVATMPSTVAAAATNNLVVTATSAFNGAVSANATDVTTAGAVASIDITVDGAGSGAKGAGQGAEAGAVSTNTTAGGTTTRFNLYLNNNGSASDTFNLSASTDPNFASATPLPSGWSVSFKDAGGSPITSATVAGNANTVVYADVSVPDGTSPATIDLYFRALSPSSAVSDRIHEAVTVTAAAVITPQLTVSKTQALDKDCDGTADTAFSSADITSGAVPGACIRYEIVATNTGAAAVSAVVLSDTIPANTTYVGTGAASTTLGTILAPLVGATGLVKASVGILAPNATTKMSFGVRIN